MSCGERDDKKLSLDQEDTYFILKNCFNGVLMGLMSGYDTSQEAINSENANMSKLIIVILIIGLVVPPVVYTLVAFFVYRLKIQLARLLSGLNFLSSDEINSMKERFTGVDVILKDSIDELSFMKAVQAEKRILGSENSPKKTSKKKIAKVSNGKKVSAERRESKNNAFYFRLPYIFLTYSIVICGISVFSCIYYWDELKEINSVSKLSATLESLKTLKYSEVVKYSLIIAYVGTAGTARVLEGTLDDGLDEYLDDKSHTDFVETYLVQAAELAQPDNFYENLDFIENNDLCEILLSDQPYCPLYGEGVFTEGFSKVIEYTYLKLKTTIEVKIMIPVSL